MTNAEKYKEEIEDLAKLECCRCGIHCAAHYIQMNSEKCPSDCMACRSTTIDWLLQEYVEPPVDWSKVKPGTKFVYPCKPSLMYPDGIAKKKFAFYVNDVIWVMGWESGEVYPLTNVDISTIELRDW